MFTGFTQAAGDFMLGLMFNNERTWFLAHKGEYEEHVLKPFKALAQDTFELMDSRHPELELSLHVSRIYRDARRLHGNGPYKDHMWFSLKNMDGLLCGPTFWFEFGAVDYSYGMGFYSATAGEMEAYRAAIDANPAAFRRIINALRRHPEFEPELELYKRLKKDMGPILNPWYNCRRVGVQCTREFGGDLLTADLPAVLAQGFESLVPFYRFLMKCCQS